MTNSTRRRWPGLTVAGLLVAAMAACTGGIGSQLQDGTDDGSGLASGSGGAGASGTHTGGFDPGSGGAAGGGEQCAGLEVEATVVPVSMFITVDKSGSMGDNNKWNNTRAAFTSFFTDPAADGLNVALRFWPDGTCNTSCDINGCAQPQVAMGSLADPAHEQALVNLFNSKSPAGMTPMEAALAGAEQFALNYQTTAEAGERIVVILVTDGLPTACSQDINQIASYAANAYAQAEILTFAVGLQGSAEAQMNAIAQAGQTGQGYFIGNGNTEAELIAALQDIQNVAVACTFAMPESPDPNKPVDPNQVNVVFKTDPNDPGTTIVQVNDESECSVADGGWYYDDPLDPAVIYLCPSTCNAANALEEAQISIQIGCQTIVQ